MPGLLQMAEGRRGAAGWYGRVGVGSRSPLALPGCRNPAVMAECCSWYTCNQRVRVTCADLDGRKEAGDTQSSSYYGTPLFQGVLGEVATSWGLQIATCLTRSVGAISMIPTYVVLVLQKFPEQADDGAQNPRPAGDQLLGNRSRC